MQTTREGTMALRHVVMFRFSDAATDERVKALSDGLDRLPAVVGTTLDYRHGPNARINEDTYDYVVVGDFATVEDYLAYRDHPEHRALIQDLLRPIMAERASIQFELA